MFVNVYVCLLTVRSRKSMYYNGQKRNAPEENNLINETLY